MKELGRKNLCYSLLLAAVMMLLLIGYFIWMLPSLYVSYTEEQNLEAIREQHRAFLETGTYDQVRVKNPTACISVKIPFEEPYVEFTSKMTSLRLTVTEKNMQQLLKEIQSYLREITGNSLAGWESDRDQKLLGEQIAAWQNRLALLVKNSSQLPFSVEVLHEKGAAGLYYGESFQVHMGSGNEIIRETAVSDGNHQDTN